MTLKCINNKKDKVMKVNLIVKSDNTEISMWFKNWECFLRTQAYNKYKDSELKCCVIREFDSKPYIVVCVKN